MTARERADDLLDRCGLDYDVPTQAVLVAAIQEAEQAMKERCAQLVERATYNEDCDTIYGASILAAGIRALE